MSCSLSLGPSRRLRAFLWALHALALITALLTPWPWPLRLVLTVALVASGISAWRTHLNPGSAAFVGELRRDAHGLWQLRARGGSQTGRLLGSSFVHPWGMVLRFHVDGALWKTRTVVVLPDSAPADQLRLLRRQLRSTQAASGAPHQGI